MTPKSVSLTAQLLLTLVSLVIGTAAVLTIEAYRSSRQTLEEEARRTVHISSEKLEQTLGRHLELREQQAQGFLTSVESLCGEQSPSGAIGFELSCVRTALLAFRATEQATGARLEYAGRAISQVGRRPGRDIPPPGAPVRIVESERGYVYIVSVTHRASSLTLQFPVDDLKPFFQDHSGLGDRGEVFLINADGRLLTPARYWNSSTPPRPSAGEPISSCAAGPSERTDFDYRGVTTIHGVRPLRSFFNGACIDAHISYDEALAPAEGLRNQLVLRAAFFVLLGALISMIASHWIATPVRRLAVSARALQAGEFQQPIPVAGPSEVQALARGLGDMARALSDLVSRENAARREAEAANRTKDDFLAMVSHELRTPLTAIIGWAWLLRWRRLGRKDTQLALEAIERSANAQSRLVNDLLDITRIVSDQMQLNLNPVSLVDPIEAALEAIRPEVEKKAVSLETHLDGSLPMVSGDAQRLQQIVANLLTNAVKFTPPGGRVSIRLRRSGEHAEIIVTDTGAGISPEFLPHVFDRFRQADSTTTRTQAGLGLGLAIVRHLAEQHGGRIEAASEGAGKGATFTVTLPLLAGAQEPTTTARETRTTERDIELQRLDAIRVLLVDDDPDTLGVVRAILEDAGAMVETATSAAEARSTLSCWEPTVLVSDIAMPEENGYSFVRSLRSSNARLPAIALTAHGRPADREQAHAAGFQVYLSKPVQRRDLVDAVAALARPERVH